MKQRYIVEGEAIHRVRIEIEADSLDEAQKLAFEYPSNEWVTYGQDKYVAVTFAALAPPCAKKSRRTVETKP